MTKLLIQNGADVNCLSKRKNIPLLSASRNRHFEIVKLLLENGADMKICDMKNWNLLHIASKNGHLDLVKELLKFGVDVDCQTKSKNTPLIPQCPRCQNGGCHRNFPKHTQK